MKLSDDNHEELETIEDAISNQSTNNEATSKETDELVQEGQSVSEMQLLDQKPISKPARFDDYVMAASENV